MKGVFLENDIKEKDLETSGLEIFAPLMREEAPATGRRKRYYH